MKYGKDSKFVRELLKAADIDNTIRGGMSQPRINLTKESDHYLIRARIPGVAVDNLQIEIVDNTIILYHAMTMIEEHGPFNMPHVVSTFNITSDVDYQNIAAHEVEGTLHIILPFNELAGGGFNKRIEITR